MCVCIWGVIGEITAHELGDEDDLLCEMITDDMKETRIRNQDEDQNTMRE